MNKVFKKSIIKYNEDLSKHCAFGIGGKAKIFIHIADIYELIMGMQYFDGEKIKYHLLGNGSNTLFSSDGFDGAVLCLTGLDKCRVFGSDIYAECGVPSVKLFKNCYENSLKGLEFISAIPGTVGGMAKMNAGAYGGEIGHLIKKVWIFRSGQIVEIEKKDLHFSYRSFDSLQENDVILSLKLGLEYGEKRLIADVARQQNIKRHASQPTNILSCGSVFKRHNNQGAGYYIDKAGLKGYQVGGAKVSEKHAGFIDNFNNANSQDVLNLVDYIEKVVYNMYGIKLHREMIYVPK